MKAPAKLVALLVAVAGITTPTAAPAAADGGFSASATPTTRLKSGDTLTLTVSGLSGSLGVYASICQQGATLMDIPTLCDQSSTVWVTAGAPGSVKSPAAMVVQSAFDGKASRSAATSTPVNCVSSTCVLYIRGDHNNMANYSLIRTIPLTFTFGGRIKTPDTATAHYGTVVLQPNQAGQLYYRTPIRLKVLTKSQLPVVLTSLTPSCGVAGETVTALSGTGVCAIAATTKGNLTYAPLSVNFPFYLNPAKQVITAKWPKPLARKVGTAVAIEGARITTNMEQEVNLSADSSSCSITAANTGWSIRFTSAGACAITASAEAKAGKWTAAELTAIYTVR